MHVAVLGGTGAIGEGLTLRFGAATDHEITVGSRERDRADSAAARYERELGSHGHTRTIHGASNVNAATGADVVVLAVPPYHVRSTLDTVAEGLLDGATVVSPAVGMERTDDGFEYDPPGTGSLTALVNQTAPDRVDVVGAYHTLPAARLADLDASLGMDVPVVADGVTGKERIWELTEAVDGLRPLDAGPIANAGVVEALTPLLLTLAQHNEGFHDIGARFS